MKTEYKIGDDVWIFMSYHKGEKTKATVVHSFKLYAGKTYYVCEVPTPIDPLLQVRDIFSMAESEDKPIGLHQLIKSKVKK